MPISNVTVILPSYNPNEKLIKTVEGLIAVGFSDIVIVNDGSRVENDKYFPDHTKYPQCTVINHWVNRGKGAGLKTAFAFVRKTRPNCLGVVTTDDDGQHRPEDVLACAMRMINENRVVLGVRDFNLSGIPARSVFGNKLTSFVFRFLCGMRLSDTQTGLRAIPAEWLETLISVKGDRFEYETNMLLAFKDNDIEFVENPIETIYIEENKTSHFNPLKDSVIIYVQILKYLFSSLTATAIDLGVFALCFALMFSDVVKDREVCTAICSVIARVISSLCNYYINFRFVFSKKKGASNTLIKYYLLVVGIMAASSASTALISGLLPKTAEVGLITLVKAAVDTVLFLVTFTLQREWVFGGNKKK